MYIWAVVGNVILVILKREAVERKNRHLGFFKNEPVWFAGISCIQFHDQAGTSKKGNFGVETDVLCLMLNKLGWYRKSTGHCIFFAVRKPCDILKWYYFLAQAQKCLKFKLAKRNWKMYSFSSADKLTISWHWQTDLWSHFSLSSS